LNSSYFLGIDGGGSKCKARLEDANGKLLAEYISGPANPMRDYELALRSIKDAISGVFTSAKVDHKQISNTHTAIGLAGLNIPSCLQKMQKWEHPFASLLLTTDLHIACVGAHENVGGAIVIIGTGSSGVVCTDSTQIEFGGHGFLLGDKGSGAWFGAEAIRHTLESIDGLSTQSPFVTALLKSIDTAFACEIVEQYAKAPPAKFAQLAPMVFEYAENGDEVALMIAQQGAAYIDQLCIQILKHKPQGLSLIGGLAHKVQPWLSADIQAQINAPLHPPEVGATIIARQQHALGKQLV
jgi:glucosamine kinase